MILFLSLLPALFGVQAGETSVAAQVRTTLVQDEYVTRVPVRPRSMPRFIWAELDGPRCIASRGIEGALLGRDGQIDFMMSGNRRFRAKVESNCPALDFYDGFYLNSPNRMICAGRDEIRSRMGASCSIESFTQLIPLRRVAIP